MVAVAKEYAMRDSNPQPPDSKSDTLSIAPTAPPKPLKHHTPTTTYIKRTHTTHTTNNTQHTLLTRTHYHVPTTKYEPTAPSRGSKQQRERERERDHAKTKTEKRMQLSLGAMCYVLGAVCYVLKPGARWLLIDVYSCSGLCPTRSINH